MVDEVVPGVWRIALDLPWPGAPPANAWALACDGGAVLVDTGFSAPGSLERLKAGLRAAGFDLTDVRLVACTHAHGDHIGHAAPVAAAAGCELWLHADHRHGLGPLADRENEIARRLATGRRCGVPETVLEALAVAIRAQDLGIAGTPRPDRILRDGVSIDTDAGAWQVVETPGHAPSHVCLFEPEAGLLLSGDHVLEQPSIGLDHGWTPDPAGELLASLDRVEQLGARICLPGHGAPFVDVDTSIAATRAAMHERLDAVRAALGGPASTVLGIAERAYAEIVGPEQAGWMYVEALCLLEHLERRGEAALEQPARWLAGPPPG